MKGPLPEPVKAFVAAAPVCRIATVRADGTPHIIPVCPAFDGESTVYVDLAERGVSARAMAGNDKVTAIFDEYSDDWSKLRAVMLRCKGERITGGELDRAWDLLTEKFPQGKAIGWTARHTVALRVQEWTEWGLVHPLGYQPE